MAAPMMAAMATTKPGMMAMAVMSTPVMFATRLGAGHGQRRQHQGCKGKAGDGHFRHGARCDGGSVENAAPTVACRRARA